MTPELVRALSAAEPAHVGARLRAARVAAGLTQPALAGRDYSVTYVSRIESGQRRPGPDLLTTFAGRLGVTVEYLVLGEAAETTRRLELQLDHAELALAGGEALNALGLARTALTSAGLTTVPGGLARARYVEAAALDADGDPEAVDRFTALLDSGPDWATAVKAATALSRILRERGDLERAIGCARGALAGLPSGAEGTEESVRLSVTLAAALFEAGYTDEAAAVCDRAIGEAEQLSSPVARASAYWNSSVTRAEAGHLDDALSLARRALHLLENTERVRDVGRLRTQLSDIMLRTDPPRLEDARQQLGLADVELDWSEATPADKARNDLVNARALYLEGDPIGARQRALTALEAAGEGLPLVGVTAMTLLGQVEWTLADRDAARAWYRQAITALTGIGADREAGQLWFEVGTLADEAGLVDEARDAYRRAAASTGLRSRLTSPASHSVTT